MSISTILPSDIDSLSFELSQVEAKPKPQHYINNKELQAEFVKYATKKAEWLAEGKGIPPLTDKIGRAIMAIANRRVNSWNFAGYTQDWKEEMVGDAIEVCCKYAHNYDPFRFNNPFAYLTQSISNAMVFRIKKEKRQLYLKYKSFDAAGGFQAFNDENVDNQDVQTLNETSEVYSNYLSFIAEYEKKDIKEEPSVDEVKSGLLEFLD